MTTDIEWTDETWNPIVGCSPVSEGCRHCYAATMAWRLAHIGSTREAYEGLTKRNGAGKPSWTGKVRLIPERLEIPLRWRKPRRVFVCSMGDLFHEHVCMAHTGAVFGIMAMAPGHTFQVLTKRPQAIMPWVRWMQHAWQRDRHTKGIVSRCQEDAFHEGGGVPAPGGELAPEWPLPNVWLGASVESARHLDRIDHLRDCPAAVRFLSCEPLLGPLGMLDLTGIHWVIVGGESGPGARPMFPQWAREIRDQCEEQGVAFFFKQHGSVLKTPGHPKGSRHLDGRIWDEMPGGTP